MGRTNRQWTASGTRWQQGNQGLPHSVGWVSLLAILLMVYQNNTIVTAEPEPQAPESTFVLQFDGTDDRVIVPYDASFPTEVFTASAWIKLPQPAGRAAIIARGEDDNSFNLSWQLYVTRDGNLETMLEDANENNYCYPFNNCAPLGTCTIVGDLFVADDTWHHVAVTRNDARTLSFYIDGERRASCEGTGIPSSNNFQDLSIGSTFGTIGPPPGGVEPPVWFFPGLIDQPAMWNVALTDAQVTGLFGSGVDPLSSGLVGYWTFNEGTGQVVADSSPAGNDGFLGELPNPDSADPLWSDAGEADEGEADTGDGTPNILVANFMNGNTDTFNSRVYLWNPSTSPGNVTVRVFTLPLMGGLAQELTSSPLNLGTLGARSALNLNLAENILTPLGITTPYITDGGNLTVEFTVQAADVRAAAQVFSDSFAFGVYPLQVIPSNSGGTPTVLVANFLNGNNDAFSSRVYLWNPSTSPGNVTIRVFTLPLSGGLAQELTETPLDLGILGAKSALNLRLVEDILPPLGITTPYTTNGGNLTLDFTIQAADARGVAQVFSSSFAFGTHPLQEIPSASPGNPTVLVANFMNGNNDAFNSRVYLWNPSESAGEVTVRVFPLPVSGGSAGELTDIPLNLGTLGAKSALNVKLAEDILTPLGMTMPYTDDGGNLTVEFTIQAEKVRGAAQVFSSDFAFGTNPLVPIDSPVPTLPIPSLYGGEMQGETKTFDLLMQNGSKEFIAGFLTSTSGYNGDYLGPTLLMRKGDQVVLNVTNQLGERTSTHWHGLHVPAAMDGGPHQMIESGETWTASFPVLNRAATYWYHPHLHPSPGQGAIFEPTGTGYQVYRGLAGMIIIEDGTSDTLALPRSYGRDDIPLILQDRRFHEDGSLMHFPTDFNPTRDPALRKGGHFLVNGVEGPILEVGAQVVRLRILNASNARVYNLGFSDERTFYQVVSDGGFLPAPVPLSRLVLAPAERAEILLDLGTDEGGSLTLRSFNSENGTMFVPPPLQDPWDTPDFDLLEIRIGSTTADAVLTLPEALATVTRIPEFDAVNAESPRPFELNANPFGINGKRMDMAIIDEQIRLGDTEIWEITNPNSQAHPFHVHGDSFQILSRDGSPPPAHELGWKDVVLVRPFGTARIIKRFHDYADPVNPYMFHCHILEHEDVGMMGQFVVVDSEATAAE